MKRFLLLTVFISVYSVYGQQTHLLEKNLFKINLLAPSVEYEVRVSSKTTLDFKLGVALGVSGGSGRKTDWTFIPFTDVEYRYFYNLEKRKQKGKKIANNTGNYVAFISEFLIGGRPIIGEQYYVDDLTTTIGPVWGIQRNNGRSFNYGLKLGLGYRMYDKSDNEFTPIIGFDLGWVIN